MVDARLFPMNAPNRLSQDTIILFDLDGTLIHTDYANFLAYRYAVREITRGQCDINMDAGRRFDRKTLKASLPQLGDADIARIVASKVACYEQFLPETKLHGAVAHTLRMLSPSHTTVLVTGCEEQRAVLTLRYHGLLSLFRERIFSRATPEVPTVNKYEQALARLGASAHDVIVFENDAVDINHAILAGIPQENIVDVSIAS